jgi:predicted metal-binding transcription factor (methanogenesis marker protein 9)
VTALCHACRGTSMLTFCEAPFRPTRCPLMQRLDS